MTIRSTMSGHAAVVEMAGSLAAVDMSRLHTHLLGLLRERRRQIVLDFRGVDHVSYQDASHLAREFEMVRSYNGDLKVAGLSPYVRNILLFAGLSDFLETNTPDGGGPGTARMPHAS